MDRDFKSDIWKLFSQKQCLEVLHNPMSKRYRTAQERLGTLARDSEVIAFSDECAFSEDQALGSASSEAAGFKVVFYLESEIAGCGEYFVCELFYQGANVVEGCIYCYYDGTDGSYCFKSNNEAAVYAFTKGYEEIL